MVERRRDHTISHIYYGWWVAALLLVNGVPICRAFVSKTRDSRVGVVSHTPKMTISPEMVPSKKKIDFDLDLWQAGPITSFSQTCFAEYWDVLPSIQEDDRVDPWDFLQRMALQKSLIQDTGGEAVWGEEGIASCSQHPIWGYAAQLDWQYRSGRFKDPSEWQDDTGVVVFERNTNTTISKRSWWGYMNLDFSVACYWGAAKAGLVPKIVLTDQTVLTDDGFRNCVGIWENFWDYYKVSLPTSRITEDQTHDLYRELWKTHTGITKTGIHHAKELEAFLPKQDRDAGLGWGAMVELLAATNWPLLSLDALCKFGCGYLPSVRLAGPKTLRWMKKNRPMEYTTVTTLHQLTTTPPNSIHRACMFFGRVARWRFAVNNLPRSLHVLTHGNPIQKTLALLRVVLIAALPRKLLEKPIAFVTKAMGKIVHSKQFVIALVTKAGGKIAKTKRFSISLVAKAMGKTERTKRFSIALMTKIVDKIAKTKQLVKALVTKAKGKIAKTKRFLGKSI